MSPHLTTPTFEHHPTGLGLNTPTPRISWRFTHSDDDQPVRNWKQTAHEIEVYRVEPARTETFRVASSQSALVPWPSAPLRSGERANVRVRAFGSTGDGDRDGNEDEGEEDGSATEWTEWTQVETGLLERADWRGDFIAAARVKEEEGPHRAVLLRKEFECGEEGIVWARLYVTALGVYQAHVNGRRVGDEEMAPGWTSYAHRLQYQVYNVTEHVQAEGKNVVGVEVGEGWYAGRLRWGEGVRNFYGDRLGALVQLEVRFEDGRQMVVVSDGSWRWRRSAVVSSEIYDGEVYDAREEPVGNWTSPEYAQGEEDDWQRVAVLPFPSASLVSPDAPPVRITQTISPQRIFKSKTGKTLVDFGQNLVGRVLIRTLSKPPNHTLHLHHAEVLEHNELCTRPLRSARATDTLIFSHRPLHNWSPHFTFHGFRYVELEGWSIDDAVPPTTHNVAALVLHSDMQRTGHFHCSHARVNQLHANIVWSMRGNFLSLPTDCPQRDERLGWTGDIQVFAPTASFLFASGALLGNWLGDLAIEQLRDGGGIVPLVVPNVLDGTSWPRVPQAVWDDAAVLVPWTVYRWTGDAEVLRRQLPSMRAHLETAVRRGPDGLWDEGLWQLGDWLDPRAPPEDPGLARTDGSVVADAYLVYVTGVMGEVCAAVGEEGEAGRWRAEAERLRVVFGDKYVARSGLVVGDTQTSLALALVFGLHGRDGGQVKVAGERLARLVRYERFRVGTGFAGTPVVLAALTAAGQTQVAYRMLEEETCPSWLYPVTMGATTVWERWDSMLPDGSVNPGEMTSFNHYALGSVADWLHTTVGGISPTEAGWRKFKVRPQPGGSITSAEVSFESPYGLVAAEWVLLDGSSQRFRLKATVPPNTEALVVMPAQTEDEGVWVGSGLYEWEVDYEPPGPWPPKALYTQFKDGPE